MKKLIASFVAFTGISLSAGVASATNSYICYAYYYPGSSAQGSNGYVSASLYTGADCTGTPVASYVICSSSATSSACPVTSGYWYNSDVKIVGIATKIIDAAQWNLPVQTTGDSCIGGGGGCLAYFNFY